MNGPMDYGTFKRCAEGFVSPSEALFNSLSSYVEMIKGAGFNLVGPKEWPRIWERHILDSLQLVPHMGSGRVCDLGAGAGFPGLVLSIAGIKNITLVESIGKKARFLSQVIDKMGLETKVFNQRVETLSIPFDVITARAVSSLKNLLHWTTPIRHEDTVYVLLKGSQFDSEVEEARNFFHFSLKTLPSHTDPFGKIVKVTNVAQC